MIYNMDFLISAMVILLLILWHFLGQKRAEDLNNRVFLFFAVLGTADVPFIFRKSALRDLPIILFHLSSLKPFQKQNRYKNKPDD